MEGPALLYPCALLPLWDLPSLLCGALLSGGRTVTGPRSVPDSSEGEAYLLVLHLRPSPLVPDPGMYWAKLNEGVVFHVAKQHKLD